MSRRRPVQPISAVTLCARVIFRSQNVARSVVSMTVMRLLPVLTSFHSRTWNLTRRSVEGRVYWGRQPVEHYQRHRACSSCPRCFAGRIHNVQRAVYRSGAPFWADEARICISSFGVVVDSCQQRLTSTILSWVLILATLKDVCTTF